MAAVLSQNQIDDADSVIDGTGLLLPGGRPLPRGEMIRWLPLPTPSPASILAISPVPENLDGLLSAGWLQVTSDTVLFNGGGRRLHSLPAGCRLERSGGLAGRRIQVRAQVTVVRARQ